MSSVRTYLLAPNFSFPRNGPIAIGNIIADPFKPQRVLTSPDPHEPAPVIETIVDSDYSNSRDGTRGLEAGIWAHFLQTLGFNLGGQCEKGIISEHTMHSLETSYLKCDPSDEEIRKRVQAPRVQSVIKSGIWGPQPVYMISGVKIAKGFSASKEVAASRGGDAGVSVPVSAEVSLGADVKAFMRNTEREAFRAEGDRVYAYQLLKVAEKGWWRRRRREKKIVTVEDYYPKAAYLNDGSEGEDEEELAGMEAAPASLGDFPEEDREQLSLKLAEIQEGQERCLCVSFNE